MATLPILKSNPPSEKHKKFPNQTMPPPLASLLFLLLIISVITFTADAGGPTVSFSPKTLQKSGDNVKISWSNVNSPSKLDWLGIYSPSNSSSRDFIGYFFLSSSSTWESGYGSLTFPLINLRSPYQFRIFRWSESEITERTKKDHDQNPLPGTRHELARSEQLSFQNLNGPEQIRLAFTGREGEMRVMFVTGDGRKSFVKYGPSEDDMEGSMVETEVIRYEREDMCDAPANRSVGWRDPGFIHDGVISDLKNGKRYYYQVGSDSGGWSSTYSFVSRDEESDETVAFLYGDMGTATPYNSFIRTQDESRSTIKWILRDLEALGDKPAFISHIGDISYARGYAWIWDNFFNQVEPVSSKVAYHVCIGNHEYDWPSQPWKPDWAAGVYGKDGGGECGVPYSLRFKMPGNSSVPTGTRAPATRNLYYSFDMGSVHFVYFSTETDFLPGSPQFGFLKQDLESVDRKKTPFVVVQGHRPMYTTSHEDRDVPLTQRMLQHIEPLFVKNNVSVALWGHVHRYERFCPLNNFTCASMGLKGEYEERYPAHLVIGMAGQDWQPMWEPRPTHPDVPVYPQPVRSLYRGGEFGYIRLFANKEKLTLSYVGNHDGEVHDAMEFLASGQALSGGGGGSGGDGGGSGDKIDKTMTKDNDMESSLPLYVKGASVLLLGTFLGYVIGFVSRYTREPGTRSSWLPVKTQES